MKMATIGLGVMGQNHVRTLSSLGVLAYVCDVDSTKLKETAERYNVIPCNSIGELLDKKPDAITVAVPTAYQLSVASKTLKAKIPTLAEKPIASNMADATEMISLAAENNTMLAVGYVERFNPAFQSLLKLVKENYFGDITSVNIKRVGGEPRSASNVVLDLMTHDIDLLTAIFGREPSKIYAHRHCNGGVINSAQVLFDFGDASATCESNWISPVKIREVYVTGNTGCVAVDMIRQELTEISGLTKNSKSLKVHNFNLEPLKEEMSAFISDVKDGAISRSVSGEIAARTLRLTIEAAGI